MSQIRLYKKATVWEKTEFDLIGISDKDVTTFTKLFFTSPISNKIIDYTTEYIQSNMVFDTDLNYESVDYMAIEENGGNHTEELYANHLNTYFTN